MDASLWVAKTGLDAQQTRMNVISNNLANVNTTGYKRDRAAFETLAMHIRLVTHGEVHRVNGSEFRLVVIESRAW
jgi:flagellar basal-body rod protein FlgG